MAGNGAETQPQLGLASSLRSSGGPGIKLDTSLTDGQNLGTTYDLEHSYQQLPGLLAS